jgi:hypothetical protein
MNPDIKGEVTVTVYDGKLITAATGGIITNADGTSIEIPANALAKDTFVCMLITPQLFMLPKSYKYRDTVNQISRDFGELDMSTDPWTVKPLTFNLPVKITIPYAGADIGDIPDEALRIFYYDNINASYVIAGGNQAVNEGAPGVNGSVTAEVMHFSTYRIIATYITNNFDGVKAYPSPFNPLLAVGGTFKVVNIPSDCEAGIYTISGEKVRSLKEADMTMSNAGWVEWDGKNDANETVGAGVYVVVIKAKDGSKKIIKVGVVK